MKVPTLGPEIDIDNTRADASVSNLDPFKFSHGLTGTNQPGNFLFVKILVGTALLPATLALSLRITTAVRNERRRIRSIVSPHLFLREAETDHPASILMKRHLLYAPSFLPGISRAQFATLTMYLTSNLAYTFAITPSPRPQALAELRARAGSLATLNLIFSILFALRTAPLKHLGLSLRTLNLLHRCTARLTVFQSAIHVAAFAANAYTVSYRGYQDWESIVWVVAQAPSYQAGAVAFCAFAFLVWHSVEALRAAAYDLFLVAHRIGVTVAVFGVWGHLAAHELPQLPWMWIVGALFGFEGFIRLGRIVWGNFAWRTRRWSVMEIEALPGEATRVSIVVPKRLIVRPGSHVHLYIPRLTVWASHPFSVAWSEPGTSKTFISEKLANIRGSASTVTKISCILRAKTGATFALHKLALSATSQRRLWCVIEGPCSIPYSLDSYGTVLLFGAGVGITHILPFIRHLLLGHSAGTVAVRKIVLVWSIRNIDMVEWARSWLEELTDLTGYDEVVRVNLYVTDGVKKLLWDRRLAGLYVNVKLQRCEPLDIVEEIVREQVGAMGVVVCGPEAFTESVREAVRYWVGKACIDFWDERGY